MRLRLIIMTLLCSLSISMTCFACTQNGMLTNWDESIDSVSIFMFKPKLVDEMYIYMNNDSIGITIIDVNDNLIRHDSLNQIIQRQLRDYVVSLFVREKEPIYLTNTKSSHEDMFCAEFDLLDVSVYSEGACIKEYHIEGSDGYDCNSEWQIWDRRITFSCYFVSFRTLLYDIFEEITAVWGRPKIIAR